MAASAAYTAVAMTQAAAARAATRAARTAQQAASAAAASVLSSSSSSGGSSIAAGTTAARPEDPLAQLQLQQRATELKLLPGPGQTSGIGGGSSDGAPAADSNALPRPSLQPLSHDLISDHLDGESASASISAASIEFDSASAVHDADIQPAPSPPPPILAIAIPATDDEEAAVSDTASAPASKEAGGNLLSRLWGLPRGAVQLVQAYLPGRRKQQPQPLNSSDEGSSGSSEESSGSDGPDSPEAALAGHWWDAAVGLVPWRRKKKGKEGAAAAGGEAKAGGTEGSAEAEAEAGGEVKAASSGWWRWPSRK